MDTTLPSPQPSPLSPSRPRHTPPRTGATAVPASCGQLLVLDARGHSQALDCPANSGLRILQGRVWISREGAPEDLFLDSGQYLRLHDAARLHLSAEQAAPAWVRLEEG